MTLVTFPDGAVVWTDGDDGAELTRRTAELLGREVRLITAAQEGVAQQQARLAGMQAQGRPEDVAAAQSALAAQNAKLNLMLSGGRPEAVTQAQAAVDAAQQKLALLQKGATDDVRQAAVSAVSADVEQVTATEAAYAALGGTSAADLPCRAEVRLSGPVRVVGHDRRLDTPADVDPVAEARDPSAGRP